MRLGIFGALEAAYPAKDLAKAADYGNLAKPPLGQLKVRSVQQGDRAANNSPPGSRIYDHAQIREGE